MASSSVKKVVLKSSDGEKFLVEEPVAMQSQLIRDMIEEGCADGVIPLYNVNSEILSKVIEYCKKAAAAGGGDEEAAEEDLRGWDSYFENVDLALVDLLKAADYLNIKGLGDLIRQTMADMVKGKTPGDHMEENIEILTPEEQEEFRRENQRAFGGEDRIEEKPHSVFDNNVLLEKLREKLRRAFEELMRASNIEEHRRALKKFDRAFGGEDRIEEKHHSVFDNKELLEKFREKLRRAFEEVASASDNEELRRTFEELMRASNIEEYWRAYEEFERAYLKHRRAFGGEDRIEEKPHSVFDNKVLMEKLREEIRRACEERASASDNEELRRTFEKLMRASNIEEHRRASEEFQRACNIEELRAFDELRSAFYIEELRVKFLRAFDNEEIPQASDIEELGRRAIEKVRWTCNLMELWRALKELRRAFEELRRAFVELRRASEIEEKRLLDHIYW